MIKSRNIEDKAFKNQVKALQLKGIQFERDGVQILLEKGEITHKIAYSLKQLISYDEMILLDKDDIKKKLIIRFDIAYQSFLIS